MNIHKHLKFILIIFLFLGTTTSSAAADISGTWSGEIDSELGGKNNNFNIRMTFKADGSSLTGKVNVEDRFELQIVDGKIEGDKINFNTVLPGRNSRQRFKPIPWEGTIEGDKIHIATSLSQGKLKNFVAKKISSVRELSGKVVDGLGRPLKDVVIKIEWHDLKTDVNEIRRVELATLRSDDNGIVKGAYDDAELPAGITSFMVEKPGYQGYSSSGWKSEFVLRRKFDSSDLIRITEMDGDAQIAELREFLSNDFDGPANSRDIQIFEMEHILRTPLRELVKDKKMGAKAGEVLAFIGVPEDLRLFIKYAPPIDKEPYTSNNSWAFLLATAMFDPKTEEEWDFLQSCALNKLNDGWAQSGAINTLKLIASPRSRETLVEIKKKINNINLANYIDRAIAYIDSNPEPLSDADLVTAGKKVTDTIKVGDWEGNREPVFNQNHDKAIIYCNFGSGIDGYLYTATFHKVDGIWKLRGVRETMHSTRAIKTKPNK